MIPVIMLEPTIGDIILDMCAVKNNFYHHIN
jgi:hypothetical protein